MATKLIIRKEQMNAFAQAMLENYMESMVYHLRDNYPSETTGRSDEDLLQFIQTGMKKAKSYGIVYEEDILVFLEFAIFRWSSLQEDDLSSDMKKIMRSAELDSSEKATWLYEYVKSGET